MKSTNTSILFTFLLFTNVLYAQLAGDYDYSFGNLGMVETDINQTRDKEYAMLIQPDGKILVAGLWSPTTMLNEQIGLVRYNTNGTLDSSFGTFGKTIITNAEMGNYNGIELHDLKLQSDGKIVIAGGIINYIDYSWNFLLARFNNNGTFDSTFNHDGIDTTSFGGFGDIAYSLAIQSNGKIIVAGTAGTYPGISSVMIRYNTDAGIDSSFGNNGVVNAGPGFGEFVGIQADGKILLYTMGTAYQNIIQRYDSLGVIDLTFNSPPSPFFRDTLGSYVYSMDLQSDGKILLGGGAGGSFQSDFALTRLNSNGSPDSTFGADGLVVTGIPGVQYVYSTATQTDGKIVATGYTTDSATSNYVYTVFRYQANGTPDSSFHFDGLRQDNAGGIFKNIELQNDGKIVAAGYNSYNDTSGAVHENYVVARFLSGDDSTCTNSIIQQPVDVSTHIDSAAWFAVSVSNPYAAFQWQVNDGGGWQNLTNDGRFSGTKSPLLQLDSVTSSLDHYSFRCIITYGISCADTSLNSIISVIISGISQRTESSGTVGIYPNPFCTQISFTFAGNEPTTISLYNFIGQRVLQESFTNTTTINAAQMSNGIYFYELKNAKGEVKTGKVVKQ